MWQQASVFWSLNMRLHQAWKCPLFEVHLVIQIFSPPRGKKKSWCWVCDPTSNSGIQTSSPTWEHRESSEPRICVVLFLVSFLPQKSVWRLGGQGSSLVHPSILAAFLCWHWLNRTHSLTSNPVPPFFLRNEKTHWSKRQEKMWVK